MSVAGRLIDCRYKDIRECSDRIHNVFNTSRFFIDRYAPVFGIVLIGRFSGPDQPAADFRIDGPGVHGLPGLVNLFGIESPGLTASLAIAETVAALLD